MTISAIKRFDFCCMHPNPLRFYAGDGLFTPVGLDGLEDGVGFNYEMFLEVTGPVDSANGMVLELSRLKDLVNRQVLPNFDHRVLDSGASAPTIARSIQMQTEAFLKPMGLRVLSCRLNESPFVSVQVNRDGKRYDLRYQPFFSGNGSLPSPYFLSVSGNEFKNLSRQVCGVLPELSVTLDDLEHPEKWISYLKKIQKNLGLNSTTMRFGSQNLLVEIDAESEVSWHFNFTFHASHRLFLSACSEQENAANFGKCIRWHGHAFELGLALKNVKNYLDIVKEIRDFLEKIVTKRLNNAVGERPATCENLLLFIRDELEPKVSGSIQTIVLRETLGNQFLLRNLA